MKELTSQEQGYQYSIKLLAKRDYSIFKLKNKLLAKGLSKEITDKVIDQLVEKKFLREDYYAEARIKALMTRGYSQSYIAHKLAEEKLPSEFHSIQAVFNEFKVSEEIQIKQLLSKKIIQVSDLQDKKKKEKLVRFLVSKGHSLEGAFNAIDQLQNI